MSRWDTVAAAIAALERIRDDAEDVAYLAGATPGSSYRAGVVWAKCDTACNVLFDTLNTVGHIGQQPDALSALDGRRRLAPAAGSED